MSVIEIRGVKFDVDMREAVKIEAIKVGDQVKVLKNEGYGDSKTWKVYPGVIAGFEAFPDCPTIVVAYLDISYSSAKIEFEFFNADSKDTQLVKTTDDYIPIERESVVSKILDEIVKHEEGIKDLQRKLNYFNKNFGKYFGEAKGEK